MYKIISNFKYLVINFFYEDCIIILFQWISQAAAILHQFLLKFKAIQPTGNSDFYLALICRFSLSMLIVFMQLIAYL